MTNPSDDWRKRAAFDPSGYVSGKPVRPPTWSGLVDDQPAGAILARHAVPPGFLLVQSFLTPDECARLRGECAAAAATPSTVSDGLGTGSGDAQNYRSSVRTSDFIDVRAMTTDISTIIERAFRETVAPFYGVDLEWREHPEILKYRPGAEFKPHADADVFDPATQRWNRTENRDLSVLIYLNDDFQGGEIVFPNFGMSLPPKAGLLIAFPSDGRYAHAARPVKAGERYVIVSWAAVRGSERVGPPRAGVTFF